jgi:DNA end-binding protein Ku
MGMLLRYPYEIRDENEYFDDIQDVKVTKEMLDLARHIVETKSADFEPGKFEDRYENALVELLNRKRKGEPVRTAAKQGRQGEVHRSARNADGDSGKRAEQAEDRRQGNEADIPAAKDRIAATCSETL